MDYNDSDSDETFSRKNNEFLIDIAMTLTEKGDIHKMGNKDRKKLLKKIDNMNYKRMLFNQCGGSILEYAANGGDLGILEILLKNYHERGRPGILTTPENIICKSSYIREIISIGIRRSDYDLIELALKYVTDINETNSVPVYKKEVIIKTYTALKEAMKCNNPNADIIELLKLAGGKKK